MEKIADSLGNSIEEEIKETIWLTLFGPKTQEREEDHKDCWELMIFIIFNNLGEYHVLWYEKIENNREGLRD